MYILRFKLSLLKSFLPFTFCILVSLSSSASQGGFPSIKSLVSDKKLTAAEIVTLSKIVVNTKDAWELRKAILALKYAKEMPAEAASNFRRAFANLGSELYHVRIDLMRILLQIKDAKSQIALLPIYTSLVDSDPNSEIRDLLSQKIEGDITKNVANTLKSKLTTKSEVLALVRTIISMPNSNVMKTLQDKVLNEIANIQIILDPKSATETVNDIRAVVASVDSMQNPALADSLYILMMKCSTNSSKEAEEIAVAVYRASKRTSVITSLSSLTAVSAETLSFLKEIVYEKAFENNLAEVKKIFPLLLQFKLPLTDLTQLLLTIPADSAKQFLVDNSNAIYSNFGSNTYHSLDNAIDKMSEFAKSSILPDDQLYAQLLAHLANPTTKSSMMIYSAFKSPNNSIASKNNNFYTSGTYNDPLAVTFEGQILTKCERSDAKFLLAHFSSNRFFLFPQVEDAIPALTKLFTSAYTSNYFDYIYFNQIPSSSSITEIHAMRALAAAVLAPRYPSYQNTRQQIHQFPNKQTYKETMELYHQNPRDSDLRKMIEYHEILFNKLGSRFTLNLALISAVNPKLKASLGSTALSIKSGVADLFEISKNLIELRRELNHFQLANESENFIAAYKIFSIFVQAYLYHAANVSEKYKSIPDLLNKTEELINVSQSLHLLSDIEADSFQNEIKNYRKIKSESEMKTLKIKITDLYDRSIRAQTKSIKAAIQHDLPINQLELMRHLGLDTLPQISTLTEVFTISDMYIRSSPISVWTKTLTELQN